jgi:hypothetical protein
MVVGFTDIDAFLKSILSLAYRLRAIVLAIRPVLFQNYER